MKIGVYAGSFCPITKGHVDAIERALKLVDKLYVVVGVNIAKKYPIPADARAEMAEKALEGLSEVEVVTYDGMMADFCKGVGANVMIKSVRNYADFQQVADLTDANRSFWQGETVFVLGDAKYRHVSSSLVRELIAFNQDISQFVPECCLNDIKKYFNG